MPDQFKPGDVVKLKSGGPAMTVSRVGEVNGKPTVWCDWFDGPKKISGAFEPNSLKHASVG
jgi:uncharacterized protein YodC (DUF2158 family)